MRHLVLLLIKNHVPKGTVIRTRGIYTAIYDQYPKECQQMGLTSSGSIEPKWKHDIREGLNDAQDQGLIKHVGSPKSGEWQRL